MIDKNDIQIFNFGNNEVRTKAINNEPYFSLEDVCEILEIEKIEKAKERLDEQGVLSLIAYTPFGLRKNDFISEPNLYTLISHSRKLANIDFVIWLASEVLPIFIRDKVAKKIIKELEKTRDKDLEELRERNSFK
ncbi:BRO family protein [Lactobacillus iners]|uniref:BRO-N domain-containing protein n=1 Tax=Lactobacillus iners TaxID=147802 RepID=UPI00254C6815|nr:BRO family protein [Lactobacillus iners]MDK8133998.1 BRO family protein [Lactobacillus iners]